MRSEQRDRRGALLNFSQHLMQNRRILIWAVDQHFEASEAASSCHRRVIGAGCEWSVRCNGRVNIRRGPGCGGLWQSRLVCYALACSVSQSSPMPGRTAGVVAGVFTAVDFTRWARSTTVDLVDLTGMAS